MEFPDHPPLHNICPHDRIRHHGEALPDTGLDTLDSLLSFLAPQNPISTKFAAPPNSDFELSYRIRDRASF